LITYNPDSLRNLVTSENSTAINPKDSNILSVDFIIPAKSEKVFEIFADTGVETKGMDMSVTISNVQTV